MVFVAHTNLTNMDEKHSDLAEGLCWKSHFLFDLFLKGQIKPQGEGCHLWISPPALPCLYTYNFNVLELKTTCQVANEHFTLI